MSLSSCESELHSMVSCLCDGMFVKACAEFILGEEVEHIQYTDSSSARQLASRQGCGKVRHLSGKLLWVQEKTQDGPVSLRQVGTTENSADIGTKCLPRQRLLFLMHESGLVFVSSFESVGEEEHAHHVSKVANTAELKRIAKAVFRMSVAMGLEPVVPVGAVATVPSAGAISLTCVDVDEPKQDAWWIVAMVFLFACGLTVVMMVVLELAEASMKG